MIGFLRSLFLDDPMVGSLPAKIVDVDESRLVLQVAGYHIGMNCPNVPTSLVDTSVRYSQKMDGSCSVQRVFAPGYDILESRTELVEVSNPVRAVPVRDYDNFLPSGYSWLAHPQEVAA